MSAVKKTAKVALVTFGVLVLLVVGLGAYLYMNINSIAKGYAEKAASEALGVAVTIGDMDIQPENLKVVVSDIAVANPPGFKNEHAITIKNVTVDGESFSKDKLIFTLVQVDGTQVNLEVAERVNLGELKKNTQQVEQAAPQDGGKSAAKEGPKVIVREFALTGAQLTPSMTLTGTEMGTVKVNDIRLKNIGEKEDGVTSEEAIAQIMDAVLDKFNGTANKAGFLAGVPLNMLNDIGVTTGEVFRKNLKNSYDGEVDKLKKGLGSLKGMFE